MLTTRSQRRRRIRSTTVGSSPSSSSPSRRSRRRARQPRASSPCPSWRRARSRARRARRRPGRAPACRRRARRGRPCRWSAAADPPRARPWRTRSAKSPALAITSPVERISGPSTGSAPGKRANGSTAALTLTCVGGRLGRQRELGERRARREPAGGLDEVDAGRLRRERHRPRRARVRLEHVDLAVGDRELHVQQADDAERRRRAGARRLDRTLVAARRATAPAARTTSRPSGSRPPRRAPSPRRRTCRLAVAERVDVDLDRVLEEAVDEHGARRRPAMAAARTSSGVVADPHRAAAEDVRRPHEHRVADRARRPRPPRPPTTPSPTPGSGRRAPPAGRRSARDPRRGRSPSYGVPRIRKPAASIARASFSGVCPPNWMHDADRLLALEHREHVLRRRAARSRAGRTCRSRSRRSRGCS